MSAIWSLSVGKRMTCGLIWGALGPLTGIDLRQGLASRDGIAMKVLFKAAMLPDRIRTSIFLSRLFISHSSKNNDRAIALTDWLVREGWSGPNDIFLDLDPDRGIAAGQRWAKALEEAAKRCEAVLFLASKEWLSSKWCGDEYALANRLNKKLFALILDDTELDALPGGLTAQWQVVRLRGEPADSPASSAIRKPRRRRRSIFPMLA